ncbi:MAG: alpha/beta fold hydrolase [Planctomycetes bacterium]|nr:alpha/beta fold hydrolase [Planctomycetota bacterium]
MASIPALVAAVWMTCAGPALAQGVATTTASSAKPSASSGDRVELKTEDKQVLVGSYWGPKDQKGSAPAALLVHDAGATRADMNEVGERLAKQGFAVLAIDLRGHGESVGGDKAWSTLSDADKTKQWPFALRDVKAGANWLHDQPGVHSSNLSLVGDRAGCTLVTRYASRDENVRSIVLLDPQVEQLGFNLAKDIGELAGLPTYIAVTKETQPKAQTIAESGEKANDGNKFIEIAVFKGAAVMPTTDKSMITGIAKFMSSKAMPKKADK